MIKKLLENLMDKTDTPNATLEHWSKFENSTIWQDLSNHLKTELIANLVITAHSEDELEKARAQGAIAALELFLEYPAACKAELELEAKMKTTEKEEDNA
jgi:hypothetical protein